MNLIAYIIDMAPMLALLVAGGLALQYGARAFAMRHQDELMRIEEDIRAGRLVIEDYDYDHDDYGPGDLRLYNKWASSWSMDDDCVYRSTDYD